MESPKVIGRVWYATSGSVNEIHLLDNHTCVISSQDGDRSVPLDLAWGLDGNTYVFKLRRMPANVDRMKLPILIEGGLLTGNHETAKAMALVLQDVALQASLGAIQAVCQVVNEYRNLLFQNLQGIGQLPSIFEAHDEAHDDDEISSKPAAISPQIEDAEDDTEEED